MSRSPAIPQSWPEVVLLHRWELVSSSGAVIGVMGREPGGGWFVLSVEDGALTELGVSRSAKRLRRKLPAVGFWRWCCPDTGCEGYCG